MDDLLSKFLSFPPHPPPPASLSDHAYDEGIKSQITFMKTVPENKLLQQTSGGESTLDVINPSINTVPYVYILLAHLKTAFKNTKAPQFENLFQKSVLFLTSFDARQIRYLGLELEAIMEAVVSIARRARQLDLAVGPIRDAILKLQPAGNVLTSAHLLLAQITLDSRAFAPAVPALEKFILYFPGSTNQPKIKYPCDMSLSPNAYITVSSNLTAKLKTSDVLEYFLCTGMIYIGLQDWEKARECLENAITYPQRGDAPVSKIMVEAYKKWVLVGILAEGKFLPLPKWTSSIAAKQYHILAKPYEVIAQLFESASAFRLKAEAEAGTNVWQMDFNIGLIQCVLGAYQRFQIKNLGTIYTKISIPEIYNQTQSAESGGKLPNAQAVDVLVRGLIGTNQLRATLSNGSPPVLSFASTGPVLTESEMQGELSAATQRIINLTNEIKKTDRVLTHDKDFIKAHQKYLKTKDLAEKSGVSTDLAMDWKDEEDEDLMATGY